MKNRFTKEGLCDKFFGIAYTYTLSLMSILYLSMPIEREQLPKQDSLL